MRESLNRFAEQLQMTAGREMCKKAQNPIKALRLQ